MNERGLFGIIVANKWMRANYGEPLRKWLKQQNILSLVDFGDLPVFEGVTTYPCILICGKSKVEDSISITNVKTLDFESLTSYIADNQLNIEQAKLDDIGWNLSSGTEQRLLKKIQAAGIPLGEYVEGKIFRGVLTGLNEAFVIDKETKDRLIHEDSRSAEIIRPFLAGRDIKRYQKPVSDKYLILFPRGFTNKVGNHPKNAWKWLQENYFSIAKYLEPFKEKAEKRFDKGDYWWELRACDYYPEFEKPKIIYPNILKRPEFTFDKDGWFTNQKCFIISVDDKYLLGLLNSNLIFYLFEKFLPKLRGGFFEPSYVFFKNFPIKEINPNYDHEKSILYEMITFVNQLLKLNEELKETKLQTSINHLQSKIDYCEDRINALVYQLYGLTEEEIGIVEGV